MPSCLGEHEQNLVNHAGHMLSRTSKTNLMRGGHNCALQLVEIKAYKRNVEIIVMQSPLKEAKARQHPIVQ